MPRFTLVRFDDWEALYRTDTGEKITEEHRIATDRLLRLINADCEIKSATPEFDAKIAHDGIVPDTLSDYPEGALD